MTGPERELLGEGRYARLVREGRWEFVERRNTSGIIAIAAVNAAGEMLLVEQYRMAIKASTLELPAGLAGDEGDADESLVTAAQRELREETGYEAQQFEELVTGPPSAGITTEMITFYRASGLRRLGPALGAGGEAITLHEVPLATVHEWLFTQQAAGKVIDPKVFLGLYFLLRSAARNR